MLRCRLIRVTGKLLRNDRWHVTSDPLALPCMPVLMPLSESLISLKFLRHVVIDRLQVRLRLLLWQVVTSPLKAVVAQLSNRVGLCPIRGGRVCRVWNAVSVRGFLVVSILVGARCVRLVTPQAPVDPVVVGLVSKLVTQAVRL